MTVRDTTSIRTCSSTFCHSSGQCQLSVTIHSWIALNFQKRPPENGKENRTDVMYVHIHTSDHLELAIVYYATATLYPVVLISLVNSAYTTAPSTQSSTTCSLPNPSLRTDNSLVLSLHTHEFKTARNTHQTSRRTAMITCDVT